MSQIYKLTDIRNGMRYIGQHNGNNKNYFTGGTIACNIRKKFGKKVFKREVIVEGDFNQLLLDELERHYIRLHATKKPFGYNLTDGGRDGQGSGHAHTNESKKKISVANLGKKKSKTHRERLSASKMGKVNPACIDNTIYTFVHKNGMILNCTQYELKKNHGAKYISCVINGFAKSANGWYLNDIKKSKTVQKYFFDIATVAIEYMNGATCLKLSEKYKIPDYVISKRLKLHGVKIRRTVFDNDKNMIGVFKCDLENNVLEKYSSVNDAIRNVKSTRFLITNAINNNTTLCGFKWQYADN